MRHAISNIAALAALSVALLALSLPAAAAQKMTWKEVSHLSEVHKLAAPDCKEHLLGVYEHRGAFLMADGEAGAMVSAGRFDVDERPGGERRHDGYGKLSFPDGSTIHFKCQGKEVFKDGAKLPTVSGTGTFTQGTGRFQGIQGTLTYEGDYVSGIDENDMGGDAVLTYQAEYTLPQ